MVRACLLGLTADLTKESIMKTRSMDTVYLFGLMAGNTKVNGEMESSMEKVSTSLAQGS